MRSFVLYSFLVFTSLPVLSISGLHVDTIPADTSVSLIIFYDTADIDSLNTLSYELNYSNPDKALKLANTALRSSNAISYRNGAGHAYSNMARVYKNIGEYGKSIKNGDSAIKIYKTLNDSTGLASVYNNLGTVYYYKTDYHLAIKWYEKALKIYDAYNISAHSAILINNIALAMSELGNYDNALDYYFQALKLHEENENESGEALTLANIGIVYFNLGNLEKAMDFYERSLKIRLEREDHFGIAACYTNMGNVYMARGEHEKALVHFNKALEIFSEKKDINNVAGTCLVIGNYYLERKRYQDAISYYKKALRIGEQIQSIHIIAHASLGIGETLLSQQKYAQAYDYLKESQIYFEEVEDLNLLSYVYMALAGFYEETNQHEKALENYKKYTHLHDSLLEVKSSKRITEAELLYETEKKENEISLLTREKQLQKLKMDKQNQHSRMLIMLVAIILFIAGFLLWRFIEKQKANKSLRQKNKLLAERRKQIENQKQKIEDQIERLKELDETKARFFANISHEFRTPLTLIKGPVEDVLRSQDNELTDEKKHNLEISLENINKLKKLIDQILDLTKLQSGKLKLQAHRQDLIAFLNRQINSFHSAVARKPGLNLSFHHSDISLFLYFDEKKLETIFTNILSNAMKYSDGKGEIRVFVENGKDYNKSTGNFIRIRISDAGIGIKAEELKHVFSRFYRSKSVSNSIQEGTGIGLELTRELVVLHGGEIWVESEYGKGTTFIIDLPKGKDHLSDDEIVPEEETELLAQTYMSEKVEKTKAQANSAKPQEFGRSGQKILLVEDNTEMRNYILGHLKRNFEVVEAENGQEGLEKALKEKPDLIISDLMMPVMDGLQFLQKVRENNLTHDTAFIMLTSRADDEDRLNGYKAKADEYITKPFNSEELILRIGNMLQTRKNLEEKFSKKLITIDFEDKNLISADKEFLNRMRAIVIENIANTDFEMKDFAGKAFLSERQLRRKLNEISGLSPVEFIRQIRLLKAKELLENKVYFSIAEVSAAVGFNNPHYFSKMFKKMFGLTPNNQFGKKIS